LIRLPQPAVKLFSASLHNADSPILLKLLFRYFNMKRKSRSGIRILKRTILSPQCWNTGGNMILNLIYVWRWKQ